MSKRVTILGAGESGTGAAILAKAKGYDVFVSEKGQIKEPYRKELITRGIPFEEGAHDAVRILKSELIIKSPGIPETVPMVVEAVASGIEVIDEIEFSFRHTNARMIAITGTNGKTTTTLLTYHLLKSAGYNVGLAGNVGRSLARQVAESNHEWYVIEISSFQLDGIVHFSPYIGILLNITPDHLDRYGYSMDNYTASKFRLVMNMGASQYFIYHADDPVIDGWLQNHSHKANGIPFSLSSTANRNVFSDGDTMHFHLGVEFQVAQKDTTLRGPHNLVNSMAAIAAACLSDVPVDVIREALKNFRNAPHRLESVAQIRGVEFVNDSKATNVDAVRYALDSFDRPLVWIAGGVDKGNDYSVLETQVRRSVRALICLGVDNKKLKEAFAGTVSIIRETQSVHELVRTALQVAQEGDVVLLSPACASFDLFRNYEDRGDQFRKEVLDLKREIEVGVQ